MKNFKKLLTPLLVLILGLSLSGCAYSEAEIVGTWVQENGSRKIVVESDGNYSYYRGSEKFTGKWDTTGKKEYNFTGSTSYHASSGKLIEENKLKIFIDPGEHDTIGQYTYVKK
ncbi:hypothetical protein HCQ94_04690 [Actinomyces sp. zg-332]|uniref:hypothetical protein n=1 Tax=Actinomyces sp. zg-332 TaxID=2708340 RepID=UPI00142473C2|nr:hypothetical protein [Actinomyces sp. zg-332]QPK93884.1 hypothetical protein HCQ94_04690 [Actinomyces sp. zg-332]